MTGSRAIMQASGERLGTGTIEPLRAKTEHRIMSPSMQLEDIIYVAFLLICCWLAINFDSSGGGGKRARLPLPI